MPSPCGTRHAIKRTPELVNVSIIFRKSGWWGNVNLPVVSISGEKVSLHECLTYIYVITDHVVLSGQREDCTETTCMRYRTESVFKISKTRLVFSAHVLSLYYQTDLAFFELAVFALNLVVKPCGEDLVLWSKGGTKNLHPTLTTI
jgi:hypothetical protein